MAKKVGFNHYLRMGEPLEVEQENDDEAMQDLSLSGDYPNKPQKTITHRRGTRRMTRAEKQKMKHFEVSTLLLLNSATHQYVQPPLTLI